MRVWGGRWSRGGAVVALAAAAAVVLAVLPAAAQATGPAPGARATAGGKGASTTSPLVDHGGPVLASSKTYAIWWGPSAQFPSDAEAAIPQELSGFSKSSYLGIAGQYMRGAQVATTYSGSVFDGSAPPSNAPKVQTIVNEVAQFFPVPDPSAVYFVYTSNRPKGASYCGWHSFGTIGQTTVQVAYIPNYPSACDPLVATDLHANSLSQGTRAMADTTAHEFMESITDPTITAWYDQKQAEIGDKCNFVYFAPVTLSNHTVWQIQAEWSNALGACQQQ